MRDFDMFIGRLDEKMAEEPGLSDAALSKQITGSKDFIRDLRRRAILPSAPNLIKLAQRFQVSVDWLTGAPENAPAPEATVADVRIPFRDGRPDQSLPVLGTALGHTLHFGDDGVHVEQMIVDHGDVIRHIQRPPALAGVEKAYAVYIEGDSMYPRFKQGELAVVDPRRKAQIGDDVIVQLLGEPDMDANTRVVCVMVKELVRRSASWVELRQFNPDTVFRVDAAKVASIHRIVPIGDLLGA